MSQIPIQSFMDKCQSEDTVKRTISLAVIQEASIFESSKEDISPFSIIVFSTFIVLSSLQT